MECIQSEKTIVESFYWTGGTALSEFYLKHRLSEDIDLFIEKQEVDQELVTSLLKKISPRLSIQKIRISQFLGLVSYKLIYTDGEELKVDFNYYPFPQIDKGLTYKNLRVDSLYDIAANKIHTLFMKARPRDYIDLYYILQQEKYSLNKLILDAKAKFDWDIDRLTLISQFLKTRDLKEKELPKMLVSFDKNQMEKFFIDLAEKLKAEIIQK